MDALVACLYLMLGIIPFISGFGAFMYLCWKEERKKTDAVLVREKIASEFYRLAVCEMKDMVET